MWVRMEGTLSFFGRVMCGGRLGIIRKGSPAVCQSSVWIQNASSWVDIVVGEVDWVVSDRCEIEEWVRLCYGEWQLHGGKLGIYMLL